jgi:hypothetical protein
VQLKAFEEMTNITVKSGGIGDHSNLATHVPIPNTPVKQHCADDSRSIGAAKVGRRHIFSFEVQASNTQAAT